MTSSSRLIAQLGKGYQDAKTNKFVVNGQVYPGGAIKPLASCFYDKNFKPFGGRRRGKHASSRDTGIRLHRNIYHAFTCVRADKCLCKTRFGTRTNIPKAGGQIANFLVSFKAFLTEKRWSVLECEMVAAVREMGIATSVDVVCTDSSGGSIFLVEVKTGYDVGRNIPRTFDKSGMMVGAYGKSIPNTFANHHQLQLWFCTEAFEQTYGIKPDDVAVVYLKKNGKFAVDKGGSDWWFKATEKRKGLYAQLLLHTKLY